MLGGMPYLITDKEDGLLIDAGNEHQMLDKIDELIENSNEVRRLTRNARKKVETYDWEVVKKSWCQILI
ncbi:Glycosyltransferase Gtf1 [termite gut metagenome]|uniref:Glycosyltransferase Gtf1 n=1 Tax=termite gut metagenome TaxID=433724 RepID=A0A5J4R8R0_9ZZZZ